MNRFALALLVWALSVSITHAQNAQIDSLRQLLTQTMPDTSRIWVLADLGSSYRVVSPDSGLRFAQKALTLARKIGFVKGEIRALTNLGRVILDKGNLPKALQYQFDALSVAERNSLPNETAWPLNRIGSVYASLEDYRKSSLYYQQALRVFKANHNESGIAVVQNNIAHNFVRLNQPDLALPYADSAYQIVTRIDRGSMLPLVLNALGRCYSQKGDIDKALSYLRQALRITIKGKDHRTSSEGFNHIATLYRDDQQPDSCIYYAQKALVEANLIGYTQGVLRSSTLLTESFRLRKDYQRAFTYQQMRVAAQDRLFGTANVQAIEQLMASEQTRQREAEQQATAYQNRLKQYALLASLGVFLLIALILYRNNRQKQQANRILANTLTELRTTQTQLIQKEKMASLGELTAGIAHEIQNPLNFVNNFSEVSVELLEELEEEANAGRIEDVKAIAGDLRENLQRITQNGQRASNIVKGMLEHSRTSTGERQPTDLNALCDEYQRLAYQGQCAKNKDFECVLETHFDPDLPPISVVAGDMSRVLLNLFNNAFYAVGQKQKTASADYQPTVGVSTTITNGHVEIRVRDNGPGISEAIREKIFQPFFTTKPTGEGTGLGLSLSYDIVTKGHGGTLDVESTEGDGVTFVIDLPVKTAES